MNDKLENCFSSLYSSMLLRMFVEKKTGQVYHSLFNLHCEWSNRIKAEIKTYVFRSFQLKSLNILQVLHVGLFFYFCHTKNCFVARKMNAKNEYENERKGRKQKGWHRCAGVADLMGTNELSTVWMKNVCIMWIIQWNR